MFRVNSTLPAPMIAILVTAAVWQRAARAVDRSEHIGDRRNACGVCGASPLPLYAGTILLDASFTAFDNEVALTSSSVIRQRRTRGDCAGMNEGSPKNVGWIDGMAADKLPPVTPMVRPIAHHVAGVRGPFRRASGHVARIRTQRLARVPSTRPPHWANCWLAKTLGRAR